MLRFVRFVKNVEGEYKNILDVLVDGYIIRAGEIPEESLGSSVK